MEFTWRCLFSLLVVVFLPIQAKNNNNDTTLRLVQILYRHGDRTPIHTFPTDKWKDSWPEGYGQLTNVGKMQQYHLGQYFRQRYQGYLNDTYRPTMVYVRSTDKDRTLMSALSNLAGLFPPVGDQKWIPSLSWQPIPVHTMPIPEDYELSTDSACKKYDRLFEEVKKSTEAQHFNKDHKELYEYVSNHTGMEVKDAFTMNDLYDTLLIQHLKNKSLPDWADEKTVNDMRICQLMDFHFSFLTQEQRKLRGGPLLGLMIRNMENKILGKNDSMQAFIYSAHDMTIIALLSALNLYDDIPPPYASAVIVELHEDGSGNYTVKLMYRNTTGEPVELQLENCSNPCSFTNFVKTVHHMIPTDIKEECEDGSDVIFDDNLALISAIAASILGCTLLMLVIAAYAFYRRNSDQYRYLNIHSDNI